MAAVAQLCGSDAWKCVFISVLERRCIKQFQLFLGKEQLIISDVRALRPSASPPTAVTVACPPTFPSLPVCDSLQPLRSERIALRGAGRLCVGVARVGRAATAAAHLHTSAAGLPHPRRWGVPGGRATSTDDAVLRCAARLHAVHECPRCSCPPVNSAVPLHPVLPSLSLFHLLFIPCRDRGGGACGARPAG